MPGKETEAPRHRSAGRTSGWLVLITLCLLITIAFGLRLIELDRLPLSLSLDESVNGLDALQLWRTGWLTPCLQNNFGRETLFFYVQGVVLWLSGISIFSLRWASVVIGVLTIPLLYRVGQRLRLGRLVSSTPLWPGMVGLLAATGLAVSYWHLYFSRVALRAILLLPLLLAQVWCFWNGWYPRQTGPTVGRWQRWRWLAAAGLLLGISFYTYLAARLLPVVFAVFVIVELIRNRSNRKVRLGGLLVFGAVAGTVSIPLILYFIRNPQAMASRAQAISILNDGAFLPALAGNARQVLFLHFGGGWWLGHWPTLNALSGVGFLVGLLECVANLGDVSQANVPAAGGSEDRDVLELGPQVFIPPFSHHVITIWVVHGIEYDNGVIQQIHNLRRLIRHQLVGHDIKSLDRPHLRRVNPRVDRHHRLAVPDYLLGLSLADLPRIRQLGVHITVFFQVQDILFRRYDPHNKRVIVGGSPHLLKDHPARQLPQASKVIDYPSRRCQLLVGTQLKTEKFRWRLDRHRNHRFRRRRRLTANK